MAENDYTKSSHKKLNNETPRRIVPIVPVIPRKFERNSRPRNGSATEYSPPADNTVKSVKSEESLVYTDSFLERLQAVGDGRPSSSEEENLVEGDKNLRHRDDPSEEIGIRVDIKGNTTTQISKTGEEPGSRFDEEQKPEPDVEGGSTLKSPHSVEREEKSMGRLSPPEVIEEGTGDLVMASDIQNSAMEKTGFRLPSPIYPHNSKSFLSSETQLHIQTLQPHLQYPSTDHNLSSSAYPSTEHPSCYIATPPADDIISHIQTDYRGYGHIPYACLQPEHTPPTDATPSPKNDSYGKESPESLHDIQESSPTANRPPSPCSFYHGYTYGNAGSERRSLSGSAASIHDVPQGHHLPPHHYECILPSSSHSRSEGRFSEKSSVNSSKSHKDGTGMSANTLRHPVTKIDESVSESKPSWAQEVSPTSSLGSFHQPYQPLSSDFYAGKSFAVKHESWRSTTLHSLNQPTLVASPSQIPLNAYLLNQFDEDKYADLQLEVIHERDGLVMADFRLHSLIMAQNKIWQDLMNASTSEREGKKLLQLRTDDRFITSQAIEGALRVFYGEPSHLFIGSCLQIDFSKEKADTSSAWMDNALSFAASGHLLGLEEVIIRGLHIASSILCWDNVEKALSFALHGGLDPALDPDHALRVDSLVSLAKTSTDSIPSPVRGASGSLRKRARSGAGSRTPHFKAVPSGRSSLLPQCLDFIALEFPMSWKLETSACPLAEIDRLPLTAKDHSPSRKSRLVSIRFGDCPPEILSIARHRDSVLSSILLSLPFVPLKYILDQLPQSTRSRIIGPIVDERERRRIQVLQEGEIDWSQRIFDADHLAYLGWKEDVVPKQGSFLALERRWTNFDEPHDT